MYFTQEDHVGMIWGVSKNALVGYHPEMAIFSATDHDFFHTRDE